MTQSGGCNLSEPGTELEDSSLSEVVCVWGSRFEALGSDLEVFYTETQKDWAVKPVMPCVLPCALTWTDTISDQLSRTLTRSMECY